MLGLDHLIPAVQRMGYFLTFVKRNILLAKAQVYGIDDSQTL